MQISEFTLTFIIMEIKFSQTLTYEAYKEFFKTFFLKKTKLSTKITYAVIFLIGLLNLIFRIIIQKQADLTNIWVTVAFCGFPIFMYYASIRNMKSNYKKAAENFTNVAYLFMTDRFSVTASNKNKTEMLYDNLFSFEETPNLYLLFISDNTAYIIDKNQIPDSEQAAFSQLFHKISAKKTAGEHLVD